MNPRASKQPWVSIRIRQPSHLCVGWACFPFMPVLVEGS
jgi:hypothetical protein